MKKENKQNIFCQVRLDENDLIHTFQWRNLQTAVYRIAAACLLVIMLQLVRWNSGR